MKKIKLFESAKFNKLLTIILALCLVFTPFSLYAVQITDEPITASPQILSDDVFVSTEETSRRGEFEKHYLLSDGSFAAVSYAEAVHYKNDSGEWEEVDNRLSLSTSASRFTNNNDRFSVSFAEAPSNGVLASLSSFGNSFSWSLSVKKEVNGQLKTFSASATEKATVAESSDAKMRAAITELSPVGKSINDKEAFISNKMSGKLTYEKLFSDAPEIAVNYSVYHNKIEEDILITKQTDVRSFSMDVCAPGLTAILNESGAVDFVNASGEMQYRVGIPYMEDAAGEVLGNKGISVEISQNGDNCTITYTPDENWLTSSDRAYPILLDPSITTKEYNSNIVDTYVFEGDTSNHSSEQKIYFGVKSGKIHRAFIKINNLPNIDAHMPILSAKMQFSFTNGTDSGKAVSLYSLDSSWSPSTITYENQPTINEENFIGTLPYSSSVMTMVFDVSNDVNTLYTDFFAAINYGYVIKHADESKTNPDYNAFYTTDYTTAGKRPVLTINYGYALPSSLTSGEVYSFQNQGSGKYLTVHNGIDADKTNVYQSDYVAGAANQKFKLEYISSTGGYYLRAMCSSGGTNRVLDLNRINGYVSEGSNVQIYSPNDPLAQYWFIIGLGAKSFKLVPRTDMSLAITAYGDSNGTADGKSTTSAGNLFVSAYTSDSYQIWQIRDSNNVALMSGGRLLADGTYYINNKSSGKYLHYTATDVDGASGLIADLENTIRWKITPVGDNKYTIQSLENMQKYLYAEGSTNVGYNSMSTLTDAYLWKLQMASGGGFTIQNVANSKYITFSAGTVMLATPSSSTTPTPDGGLPSESHIWRLASTEEYGNTPSHSNRELSTGFSVNEMNIGIGGTKTPVINQNPNNAIWSSSSDFSYAMENLDTHTGAISIIGNNLTGTSHGTSRVKVTHKVTGRSTYFSVHVEYDVNGLDSGGEYFIKNVWLNSYLSVNGSADTNNTLVTVSEFIGASNQKWNIWHMGDDYYQLNPKSSTNSKLLTYLDDTLVIYADNGSAQQQFKLVRQETLSYGRSGQYYIIYDNKYLTVSSDFETIELTTSPDTTYGGSLWCFEEVTKGEIALFNFSEFVFGITEPILNDYTDKMGYGISYHLDETISTAMNKLNDASIWLHTGHGSPGNVYFFDSYISHDDIDALAPNELSNLRCFITLGCSSGAYTTYGTNLIDSVYAKGAQFAIGFTHTQWTGVAETWLVRFLDYANQGKTIQECIRYADEVANIPIFGTGMKYYRGDDLQILLR